jgi:hypothetical protein
MASLTELLNPSFLMFLGILLLAVAGLFLYFENKLREQNHKISSMVSLISVMAEEMNVVRSNFSLMRAGGSTSQVEREVLNNNLSFVCNQQLIHVSDDDEESEESGDDEESEESEESGDDADSEESGDDESEDSDDSDDDEKSNIVLNTNKNEIIQIIEDINDVKILKINMNMNTLDNNSNNFDNEEIEEILDNFSDNGDDTEIEDSDAVNEIHNLEENSEIHFSDLNNSGLNIPILNLKSINMNDLENSNDVIDYKKMSNSVLKSIVIEKGLTSDAAATKLTKGKLLKLLGVE